MSSPGVAVFHEERLAYHAALLKSVLNINANGVASNADKDSQASKAIALEIAQSLNAEIGNTRLAGQTSGSEFETITASFIDSTFSKLAHLRPGQWSVKRLRGRGGISAYDQYKHLNELNEAVKKDRRLAAVLGREYTVCPDIVVVRMPEEDTQINLNEVLIDGTVATRTAMRRANGVEPTLHASVSCKWTIRSDRVQNARAEALNLIRTRKGKVPHIAVVTAEPTPGRLASIALGTGDIDCVYHFALYELMDAVERLRYEDSKDLLKVMVDGRRLRDISDLPLDLAI